MDRAKQRGYPYQNLAKPSILGKLGGRCKASNQAVIQGMHRGKLGGRCKASNQAVIRGMDRGKQRGYPYQMHDKTEHPREARRSMQGIEPNGHPRDAPKQKETQEAHRSLPGIRPGGHPRDAPREAKEIPLPKHGETKHPGSMPGITPDGHPRDAPKVMDAPLPKHGKRLCIQASLFWQS
jgi:hypothetical protein